MSDVPLPTRVSQGIVLLCTDLMMTSSVGGAAAVAEIPFRSVPDVSRAVQASAEFESVLLLVDLGAQRLVVAELQQQFSRTLLQGSVAYGPHVHEQLLQDARDAGFGAVLSRGQFTSRFPEIIRSFFGS